MRFDLPGVPVAYRTSARHSTCNEIENRTVNRIPAPVVAARRSDSVRERSYIDNEPGNILGFKTTGDLCGNRSHHLVLVAALIDSVRLVIILVAANAGHFDEGIDTCIGLCSKVIPGLPMSRGLIRLKERARSYANMYND